MEQASKLGGEGTGNAPGTFKGVTGDIRGQSPETHRVTHGVERNVRDGGTHVKVTGKSKGNAQETNCVTTRRRIRDRAEVRIA